METHVRHCTRNGKGAKGDLKILQIYGKWI